MLPPLDDPQGQLCAITWVAVVCPALLLCNRLQRKLGELPIQGSFLACPLNIHSAEKVKFSSETVVMLASAFRVSVRLTAVESFQEARGAEVRTACSRGSAGCALPRSQVGPWMLPARSPAETAATRP